MNKKRKYKQYTMQNRTRSFIFIFRSYSKIKETLQTRQTNFSVILGPGRHDSVFTPDPSANRRATLDKLFGFEAPHYRILLRENKHAGLLLSIFANRNLLYVLFAQKRKQKRDTRQPGRSLDLFIDCRLYFDLTCKWIFLFFAL